MSRRSVDRRHQDDNDRLGYHPDCPTCREDRLFGILSPRSVVGRRAPAILATGVLALSAGGTATSIASEPDHEREGVSVPGELAPPPDPGARTAPPSANPNRGDEGDADSDAETALPFQVGPGAGDQPGADEDAPPLEAEPTEDPDAALPLTETAPPPAPETDEGVPPTTPPAPVVPAPDMPALTPESQQPAPPVERAPKVKREGGQGKDQRSRQPKRKPRKSPAPPPPEVTTTPPIQIAETEGVPPAPSAIDDTPGAPTGLGRYHVIRPGDSLWLIASALLGPGASDADIALEVKRLWRLNEEQIGTGDPNLLIVGVRVRLR